MPACSEYAKHVASSALSLVPFTTHTKVHKTSFIHLLAAHNLTPAFLPFLLLVQTAMYLRCGVLTEGEPYPCTTVR